MRLLIIENDCDLAQSLHDAFAEQGYAVDLVANHERGRYLAHSEVYDAILVEVKPPACPGHAVCRELRRDGITTPIILLAPPSRSSDIVRGLEAGADDFLAMPFSFEELIARIRCLLRRGESKMMSVLTYDELEIDLGRHRVRRNKTTIELAPKEFALLEFFMRNPERVVSRTELAAHVWPEHHTTSHNTIDVYISLLRRKIDRGFDRKLIRTVIGYGYKLDAERCSSSMSRRRLQAPSITKPQRDASKSRRAAISTQRPD